MDDQVDGEGTHDGGELRRLVEAQTAVVESQMAMIESLQARLARLEGPARGPSTDNTNEVSSQPRSDLEAPMSRRNLMTKGAAAAAGAVIAGTALGVASAPPAAAATGSFDSADGGTPAVLAENTAVTGIASAGRFTSASDGAATVVGQALSATADNSVGVVGLNVATSGLAKGVEGQINSSDGSGVFGLATSGTGVTHGVKGSSGSTAGIGVLGEADATTGSTVGVKGSSDSPAGVGISGEASAITGSTRGVYGGVSSPDGSAVAGRNSATTGLSIAVNGSSDSTDGIGVLGQVGQAAPAALLLSQGVGVAGIAPAITGTTRGVYGGVYSPDGRAVEGRSLATTGLGIGVFGRSNSASGNGVYASADLGTGIAASSSRTQLRFDGAPVAPLGAGLARVRGEMVFDTNNDLWLCVAGGTPGTWKRISGPSTAGAFVPLSRPVRVYDSRPGQAPAIGPKIPLVANTPRTVDCTGNTSGVPIGASAVQVNLVATNTPAAAGFMTIYTDGIPWPGTSNLNYQSGQTVAVTTLTALSATAKCAVRSSVGTDVLIDVIGFYQ